MIPTNNNIDTNLLHPCTYLPCKRRCLMMQTTTSVRTFAFSQLWHGVHHRRSFDRVNKPATGRPETHSPPPALFPQGKQPSKLGVHVVVWAMGILESVRASRVVIPGWRTASHKNEDTLEPEGVDPIISFGPFLSLGRSRVDGLDQTMLHRCQ